MATPRRKFTETELQKGRIIKLEANPKRARDRRIIERWLTVPKSYRADFIRDLFILHDVVHRLRPELFEEVGGAFYIPAEDDIVAPEEKTTAAVVTKPKPEKDSAEKSAPTTVPIRNTEPFGRTIPRTTPSAEISDEPVVRKDNRDEKEEDFGMPFALRWSE